MRGIITEKDLQKLKEKNPAKYNEIGGNQIKPDDYVSQLTKFIPGEVISFYTAIFAAAASVSGEIPYQEVSWVMFAMGLIATLVFSISINKRELRIDDIPGTVTKALLSSIAFFVWAFTLGPPFKDALPWYHAFYGTLMLAFYTLLAPKIYELIP